jgi:multisubunit Na+/H+ antiporter MnhE subunit
MKRKSRLYLKPGTAMVGVGADEKIVYVRAIVSVTKYTISNL